MTNFSASFKKGLEAAQIAEKNHNEIDEVFKSLNDQLARESDGRIAIEIRQIQGTGSKGPLIDFFKPLFTHEAIVAFNPKNPQRREEELALWSQDRGGYPCRINFGLKQTSYEDKGALEAGLAEMLEDPIVGEAFYRLMQHDDCLLDRVEQV